MAAAFATASQLPPEEPDDSRGGMSFLEHLDELRTRIIRSCIAIGIGMFIAFIFIGQIVTFVLAPTRNVLPPGTTLIFTNPPEAFTLNISVAFIAGALLATPVIMFQVWRFIAPGLYANEKKFAIPFVVLTTSGALGGAAFSHYLAFPYMMAFFGTFSSADLVMMPNVQDAFRLYLRMLMGMTIVFQIPTVVFFLAKMRVVTAGFLARNIRYAILIIFIVAAVLTPSADPWNQMLFAAPMIGLYLISIGIAWIVGPKRVKQASARAGSNTAPLVFAAALVDQARKSSQRSSDGVSRKR
jgi:sec-independent protein translocase protein TatC